MGSVSMLRTVSQRNHKPWQAIGEWDVVGKA